MKSTHTVWVEKRDGWWVGVCSCDKHRQIANPSERPVREWARRHREENR